MYFLDLEVKGLTLTTVAGWGLGHHAEECVYQELGKKERSYRIGLGQPKSGSPKQDDLSQARCDWKGGDTGNWQFQDVLK